MMDSLRIDGDELADLVQRLTKANSAMDSEAMFSSAIGSLVGDDRLDVAIVAFANAWNVRRKHLVEDLKWLSDSVGTIGQSFNAIEVELANAVEPGSSGKSAASKGSNS
ncbi:MAG TPA: hypothetical protein VHU90_07755 [Galbitalea sp.]|jgi:hypothetical protein|nr:hypothetical protein [Galbitalea sp.]